MLRSLTLPARRPLALIAAISVLLGLAIFALDFHGAAVQRDAAAQAAQWIQTQGGGRVWYAGHWGFQYYAEHHGMHAIVPAHERPDVLPPTSLARGDWIVLPDEAIEQQTFELHPSQVRELTRLTFDDPFPWTTVRAFYGTADAFQHREEPRLEVRIFQVQEDFVPRRRSHP